MPGFGRIQSHIVSWHDAQNKPASLARKDLCHTHLAFAGMCDYQYEYECHRFDLLVMSQDINQNASGNSQGRALERVMLPVSGLASWIVVCGGSIMCLAVLGINVQPLLTVGGVSTVLIGLSAQSVLANLISGINLVSHLLVCSFAAVS